MHDTPTAIAERALAHITDLAAENRRLRAELAEARAGEAKWCGRHGRVLEVDDGSYAHVNGATGHPIPIEIELSFYDADGRETRRSYIDKGNTD